jgi:hypothetical protein
MLLLIFIFRMFCVVDIYFFQKYTAEFMNSKLRKKCFFFHSQVAIRWVSLKTSLPYIWNSLSLCCIACISYYRLGTDFPSCFVGYANNSQSLAVMTCSAAYQLALIGPLCCWSLSVPSSRDESVGSTLRRDPSCVRDGTLVVLVFGVVCCDAKVCGAWIACSSWYPRLWTPVINWTYSSGRITKYTK